MRQVVAQDVVTDKMNRALAVRLQPVQRRFKRGPFVSQPRLAPNRRKGKKPRRLRINLEIDRNTTRQEQGGVEAQLSEIQGRR